MVLGGIYVASMAHAAGTKQTRKVVVPTMLSSRPERERERTKEREERSLGSARARARARRDIHCPARPPAESGVQKSRDDDSDARLLSGIRQPAAAK